MRGRSRAGGKPVKARRRKTVTRKRGNPPKAARRRSSFADAHQTELARVIRERDEALEQQAAVSDILRVISNSPSDVQPVLDSVAQHAARICEAHVVDIAIVDNQVFRIAASFGEAGRLSSGESAPLDRSSVTGRSICDMQPVHIADMKNAGDEFALGREFATRFKHRTILSMPLMRQGRALGAILVRRAKVRPFEEKHIALLKAFADQAAITIENVRLFKAEQQRTRELSESLQQQTATADVLKTISRSTFDLQPVLDTLVESAARLCEADFAFIFQRFGDLFHIVASCGFSGEFIEWQKRNPIPLGRETLTGRTALERKMIHIPDVLLDPEYTWTRSIELARFRTMLGIPLLREGIPIGVIALHRVGTVRPFTDRQIELVMTFADQALIAIENTRLLNELRESLQQQTATAEVLAVINSSPGNLTPVFDAMLEKAMRLCSAAFGGLTSYDGKRFHTLALRGLAQEAAQAFCEPWVAGPGSYHENLVRGEPLVHADLIPDDPARRAHPQTRAVAEIGGARTGLLVALRKDDLLVGSLWFYRTEVRPFTEKQVALVQNFAAQAVIAIENARLLNELRESLQQQTATADVLKVISRSTFDLQTVLNTLVESAARLCEADTVLIGRPKGESFQFEASFGYPREYAELVASHPAGIDRGTSAGRAFLECKIVHILDVLADPEYTYPVRLADNSKVDASRTLLGVPLLREGSPMGVMTFSRSS